MRWIAFPGRQYAHRMDDGIGTGPNPEIDWDNFPIELPVSGFSVEMIRFGFPLRISAEGESPELQLDVSLEEKFTLSAPDAGAVELDPAGDTWERLAVVLQLHHDKVLHATVSADSRLRVEFESGRTIESAPERGYEAWNLTAPGCFIVGAADEPAVFTGPGERCRIEGDAIVRIEDTDDAEGGQPD